MKFWELLGGVKIGMCLMLFLTATVLLCCKVIDQDAWVYISTFGVITAVGGNLAGMGIHAFARNVQPPKQG